MVTLIRRLPRLRQLLLLAVSGTPDGPRRASRSDLLSSNPARAHPDVTSVAETQETACPPAMRGCFQPVRDRRQVHLFNSCVGLCPWSVDGFPSTDGRATARLPKGSKCH